MGIITSLARIVNIIRAMVLATCCCMKGVDPKEHGLDKLKVHKKTQTDLFL